MSRPQVLIVRLTAIGDVIHALPAAAALKRHRPDAQLHWLVDARAADVLRGSPVIDRLIVVAGKHILSRPGATWRTLCDLRATHYDAVFDLQGLLKSAVLARLARSSQVWGLATNSLREPLAAAFYDQHVEADDTPQTHVAAKSLAVVSQYLRRNVVSELWEFPIGSNAARTAEVAAMLPGDDAPLIVVNPGATWQTKRWPVAHFATVIEGLSAAWPAQPPRFFITWGPGEEGLRDGIVAAVRPDLRLRVIVSATRLGHLAPLFSRAALVISGDTGPLQIALALGTPTVSIFGPTWPLRNGPFRPADVAATAFVPRACSGCYAKRCPIDAAVPPRCLQDVTPAMVVELARRRVGV